MGYRVDAQSFIRQTSVVKQRAMFAVEIYGRTAAAKLEQRAKDEAPWTDRTGLARQTIQGVADWAGSLFRIGLAGNMNYSPYLEFKDDGKFAVLWPTINTMAAEILQGMGKILG